MRSYDEVWSDDTIARFNKRRLLFAHRTQRDRLISGRLRDAWCWAGGFLAGTIATVAVAVVVIGFKVMT